MSALSPSERENLAGMLSERKKPLREEIRVGLKRMRTEGHADLLPGTADADDRSVAKLLTDVTNAEVAAELQDIFDAEARVAAGTYGTCIDCGLPIPYQRLAAYPTAKRCLRCQKIRATSRS